ncbi:uncharacterized protein LOC126897536 isoform X2 [Daktulosphaira vitifoliae]|uniref:uncharacterized protein LOC126897536 isoform X2 n=1 Tax=Daktulosphaira vitifoliae TaxID=58002 RepID=UPI0021A9A510|nr:uncharacterized protein LOC126897536 isoform X2 [Daktulosphaira vitifoliae]
MSLKILLITLTITLIAFIANQNIFEYQRFYNSFEKKLNSTSCPLCLGMDFCHNLQYFEFNHERYKVTNFDHQNKFLYIFWGIIHILKQWLIRNNKIFFGKINLKNGTTLPLVAKRTENEKTKQFLEKVTELVDVNSLNSIEQLKILLTGTNLPFIDNGLVVCSKNAKRSFSLIFDLIKLSIDSNNNKNIRLWLELYTAIHLSPEIILLKILKLKSYVPIIFGTCGNYYFVEDCGHTLQYYIGKLRLNMRMQIVYELLKLALELTDGTAHRDYSFYLTDLTADNIAIQIDSSTGLLLSLKIIDWSDVIVVSNKENRFKCKLNCCLIYSEDDICKTSYSDHNIYAVCQEFLSSGESILPEITNTNILENSNYAEFQTLIKNCVCDRSTEHQVIRNRLNTAKLMITLLEKILKITF